MKSTKPVSTEALTWSSRHVDWQTQDIERRGMLALSAILPTDAVKRPLIARKATVAPKLSSSGSMRLPSRRSSAETRIALQPFDRFLFLYGTMFAAFGVASPFLPALFHERGLGPSEVGAVLAAGTAIRLIIGPVISRLADRLGKHRHILAVSLALAAAIAFGYDLPGRFTIFLIVTVAQASALAPIVPIADAMTLAAAPGRFQYGWVRGAASAAFVVGSVSAGQVVAATSLGGIVWMNGTILALAAVAALRLPQNALDRRVAPRQANVRVLLAVPGFLPLMALAALVLSSHAMHDGFEVLRWEAGGIGPGTAGLLWSEGVLAEVVVFVVVGPALLRRLGPAGAAALAAGAGIVRWSVTAITAWLPAMVLVEPLHGLTFALLHLACMQILSVVVPPTLAATAQAIYGGLAVGTMTAIITLVSGPLYGALGPQAFWVMALLCAAALPIAFAMRRVSTDPSGSNPI
jgi:MFS transporter, PPP family, 3-phenylpropionic acid transporter